MQEAQGGRVALGGVSIPVNTGKSPEMGQIKAAEPAPLAAAANVAEAAVQTVAAHSLNEGMASAPVKAVDAAAAPSPLAETVPGAVAATTPPVFEAPTAVTQPATAAEPAAPAAPIVPEPTPAQKAGGNLFASDTERQVANRQANEARGQYPGTPTPPDTKTRDAVLVAESTPPAPVEPEPVSHPAIDAIVNFVKGITDDATQKPKFDAVVRQESAGNFAIDIYYLGDDGKRVGDPLSNEQFQQLLTPDQTKGLADALKATEAWKGSKEANEKALQPELPVTMPKEHEGWFASARKKITELRSSIREKKKSIMGKLIVSGSKSIAEEFQSAETTVRTFDTKADASLQRSQEQSVTVVKRDAERLAVYGELPFDTEADGAETVKQTKALGGRILGALMGLLKSDETKKAA